MRIFGLLALLALIAPTGTGWSQTATEKGAPAPRGEARPTRPAGGTAAVTRHAASGLVLPPILAGASLGRVVNYGDPPTSNTKLGMSYHYGGPGPIIISVFIYDLGMTVPDGTDNPEVRGQFEQARRDIQRVAEEQGKYQNLSVVAGPEQCGPRGTAFTCIGYKAVSERQAPIYTALMIGGMRGQFVKIRIDWPNQPGVANAAQAVLGQFAAAQAR